LEEIAKRFGQKGKGVVEQKAQKTSQICNTHRGVFWEIIGSECCVSELNFLECINSA